MNIAKKIGVLASVATILGFAFSFTSGTASSVTQTINGHSNTVIGENSGTITINNGDTTINNNNQYRRTVLRNNTAGVSLVLTEPTLANFTDPNTHVCNVLSGTEVNLTGNSSGSMWQEVKITSGECKGKTGWASTSLISYE